MANDRSGVDSAPMAAGFEMVARALDGLREGGTQRIELTFSGNDEIGTLVAKGIRQLNRANNLTETNGQLDVKVTQ